jgi:hypothetical protein
MVKDKYMKVQGVNYVLLGMYGGMAHLGRLYDLNNDACRSNVIWYMQPFEDKGKFFTWRMNVTRSFLRWCIKSDDWSTGVNRAYKLACLVYGKKTMDKQVQLPCDR